VQSAAQEFSSHPDKRYAYARRVPMAAPPKYAAAKEKPLNSTGLIYLNTLAHNVFHRICAEAGRYWNESGIHAPLRSWTHVALIRNEWHYTSRAGRNKEKACVPGLPKSWALRGSLFVINDLTAS
jgi:hypothetical protein